MVNAIYLEFYHIWLHCRLVAEVVIASGARHCMRLVVEWRQKEILLLY